MYVACPDVGFLEPVKTVWHRYIPGCGLGPGFGGGWISELWLKAPWEVGCASFLPLPD